jgi:hemerythrin-like domain-containing protein
MEAGSVGVPGDYIGPVMSKLGLHRRKFLAGAAGAGILAVSSGARARGSAGGPKDGGDIPPTEDLMREHGVLRRILLVYEEAARRLTSQDAVAVGVVAGAASIVRRFVEGYHEKLEEDLVFPRLEKAGKLDELTRVLRGQHAAGRKLTEAILNGAKSGNTSSDAQRRALVADVMSFRRMYAPHAAWEDTELFPVYRAQFTEREFDKLGDRFEDQEHKLLGNGGFEGSLKEVGDLEKSLGIHDLATFTPT